MRKTSFLNLPNQIGSTSSTSRWAEPLVRLRRRSTSRARSNEETSSLSSANADLDYHDAVVKLESDPKWSKKMAHGKQIGLYSIAKTIGVGQFARVKLGKHLLTKHDVAIKIMEKSKMNEKRYKLFKSELDVWSSLRHPNILTLYQVHLIVEYAPHGDLYEYVIKYECLTENIARSFFCQMVNALTYLHKQLIIHRDIKPENVLFVNETVVKLGDFGFSFRLQTPDEPLDVYCGSPAYTAPEIYMAQVYLGPPVDVWSLGVVLYFMLSGSHPFMGADIDELKENILSGLYMTPEMISAEAQDLLAHMLIINVKFRFTMRDICDHPWLKAKMTAIADCPSYKRLKTTFIHCTKTMTICPHRSINQVTCDQIRSRLAKFGIKPEELSETVDSENENCGLKHPLTGIFRMVIDELVQESNEKASVSAMFNKCESSPATEAAGARSFSNAAKLRKRKKSKLCAVM